MTETRSIEQILNRREEYSVCFKCKAINLRNLTECWKCGSIDLFVIGDEEVVGELASQSPFAEIQVGD